VASSTFYEQQAANRRRSLLLMLSVVVLLAVLGFAIGFGFSGDPVVAVAVTAGAAAFALTLALGSYFEGDKLVLAASQARPVSEAEHRQLLNVVRELSISAGIPMPAVYTIDDTALNAFATGRSPERASIAVTTGLLDRLDREELQGVIGHELSHVRNLDIRFALLIGVLVGTIVLLADWALRYAFWFGGGRSREGKGGGAQAILLVVGIVLAVVAPLVARIVQLSVSRQREYLADATSVEITRNPAGLERALARIASDQEVLEVANRATHHLYIVNPIKKFEERSRGLFSTHPPIVDRINRLRTLHGAAPVTSLEQVLVEDAR
jgi:heat shock protein HtpX